VEASTSRPRRTKIVGTIGPASIERLPELVRAGIDVARLNFSHGDAAFHASAAARVRAAAGKADRGVAVLVDLAGPKIRLGELVKGNVSLVAGERFVLWPGSTRLGDASGASVGYRRLGRDLQRGDRVLLADGAAELRVTGTGDEVTTEVVRGGSIRSRAGVSVPAARLSSPALTRRDRADLARVGDLRADYVAQSFVRSAADVKTLRRALGPDGPPIVAKIETRPAVDQIDDILDVADAVMIARGDLGVELPFEEVPIVQKQLVRRALDRGVPSIVATQMLESMTAAPRPTRAEASDVANAVFDGADAILLSAETAIGAHPILAAEAAARICELCERGGTEFLPTGGSPVVDSDAAAMAYAAVALAEAEDDVAAIACYTRTGRTASLLAALRPRVAIRAFSADPAVVSRLALIHGVIARVCEAPADAEAGLSLIARWLGDAGDIPPGAAVALVASTTEPGSGPNLLEIRRLSRPADR
jgi:pyruvate kinase